MHLTQDRESYFPNLRRKDYHVTSVETSVYNCIAHAADVDNKWWWPVEGDVEGVDWPEGIPKEETLECFILAFERIGYVPCDDATLEAGYEKVALYVDSGDVPTHAAKQLASGAWTSKLGDWEDIEHSTPESVGDDRGLTIYGRVAQFLKRPRS